MVTVTWVLGFEPYFLLQTLDYWDWSLVMKCLIWPQSHFYIFSLSVCLHLLASVLSQCDSHPCHLIHVDILVCHNFFWSHEKYVWFHALYMSCKKMWHILQWHKPSSCGWIACHVYIHIMIGPVVWGVAVVVESVCGASCTVATARSL